MFCSRFLLLSQTFFSAFSQFRKDLDEGVIRSVSHMYIFTAPYFNEPYWPVLILRLRRHGKVLKYFQYRNKL